MENKIPEFKDLGRLVNTLKICLSIYIAVSIVAVGFDWMQITLLEHIQNGEYIDLETATASDSRQAFMGILQLVVLIVTSIFFLQWVYFSNKNVQAFGIRRMEHSAGWAVGSYFVPFVSLWVPYQALREIFKASNPSQEGNWKLSPSPWIMPIWWTLWLTSNVISNIGAFSMDSESIHGLIVSSWFVLFSDLMEIPLGFLAYILVIKLYEWQSQRAMFSERLAATVGSKQNLAPL